MTDSTFLALFPAQSLKDPAPHGAIDEAERKIGRALPHDYSAFFAVSDGFDGVLGEGQLSLWPVGQLALRNDIYEVARRIDDLVLIGSDGRGTVYGIDWASGTARFISVPYPAMERASLQVLAATFEDFLRLVASGETK